MAWSRSRFGVAAAVVEVFVAVGATFLFGAVAYEESLCGGLPVGGGLVALRYEAWSVGGVTSTEYA